MLPSVQENKKPCLREVSRVVKIVIASLPACLQFAWIGYARLSVIPEGLSQAEHMALDSPARTARFRDRLQRPNHGGYVGAGFH